MSDQLLKDSTALRMFFTEQVFITTVPEAPAGQNTAATAPQEALQSTQNTYQYIGQNKRNILLLVNDHANAISTPEGTALLRNIVKHLNFDKDDFALLNYAAYTGTDFKSLKAFFACNSMLAFGVTARQLNLPASTAPTCLVENTSIVFAPALHQMTEDRAAKKALSDALKTINKW